MRPLRAPGTRLACAAAGLAVTLTACGSDPGTDAAELDPTLTVWADDERALALMTFAEAYSRTSDAQVEVIVVEHEELRASFVSAHANGLGPDIMVGPHDWTGELVESEAVAPVTLDARSAEAFTPGALDAVTYDGAVYGVPYATENLALIRNTDLAPSEPETVEELVETGADLVDAGRASRVLGLQVGEEGDAYHMHPLFTSAGGYLFGEDGAGDPDPTDLGVAAPESVAAFERIAELGEAGSGVLTRDTTAERATELFTGGEAPYFVTGPWSLSAVKEAGVPYEISPVPPFADGAPARPLIGVQAFFVAAGASDPDLARTFAADFVADPEFSVILYEADPRVPALVDALETLSEQDPDLQAFQNAGANGLPMPAIPEMDAVWGPFGQAGADIIAGAEPAEELAEAEELITASFAE
ncbi:sugar ABC transporter substrate-binding protein [Nocardiopsis aegyptia]|uniref:Arabinogalactan oligomer/maltooligosaccharide transport system substrate-binding protein n=1 Tax=Nocardiopsis aegyptia TaxID=220378 RepID=A0A7Z0J9N0_9ACTN|nr:maltose ABC transporter substrate-binding protein [Nocardiopsis aegyptia]NYJ33555.1 arabinogalactan oligomer/maltooligosaccharide transport system substrate-binding protein [Nocardiopsis aegyptia]